FMYTGATNRGANPKAPLVQGNDFQLYGVTEAGGANGDGTVFKMTKAGVLTTLADFTGSFDPARGSNPVAPLLKLADGSFLGGTKFGGANNAGTIFKITSTATLTILIDLTGTGGANRGNWLTTGFVLGSDGNYYAATQYGGI